MRGFGTKLRQSMSMHAPLCVGIDPHPGLLDSWGLNDDAAGLERFSMSVLEAVTQPSAEVAALKPQVALYERFGSEGFRVLEKLLARAQEASVLTIADAKRGDIGSTMAGYAQSWLSDGSSLAADAVTLSPYLGYESLRPAIDLAVQYDRGVFVLGLTSNPEGASVQHTGGVGGSVAGGIIDQVREDNQKLTQTAAETGPVGLVVGATVPDQAEDLGIDLSRSQAVLLAPGYGAQGASAESMKHGFGKAWPQVLVNSSRGILRCGPDIQALQDEIQRVKKVLSD